MDSDARSHRRAVWLIAGLLLAFAVGLVDYELNWIHQRRVAWAEFVEWADRHPISPLATPTQESALLPARGPGYLDRFAMRALDQHRNSYYVRCSRDDAKLPTAFDDDVFPLEPIEKLEQVRRARWLFPEAAIIVEYADDPADRENAE